MTIDYNRLRVEGVYKQNEDGHLMMRVKVPAGVLSAEQALKVCEIAERFSNAQVHLTTRCSIEFHWLQLGDLAEVRRMMASVGLDSRGACGGAVRGISCSTTFAGGFAVAQVLAARLNRHFAGNPHFENLPKKFKIGVDAGYGGSRHLIQDIGLVHVGTEDGEELYDVWAAGGLGREPIPGFLLEERLPERRLIPLIEAAVSVHKAHTPKGKRLKHLLKDIGEKKFRHLLAERLKEEDELELFDGFEKRLTALSHGGPEATVEVPVFAGELPTGLFRELARIAGEHAGGFLALTADQNIALLLSDGNEKDVVQKALAAAGAVASRPENRVRFRICPGNHECRMGLAATRDVAKDIMASLGESARTHRWAISGCGNSCAQPQLADFGILAVKAVKGEDGIRRPLFDLYRREGEDFGRTIRQGLTREELVQAVVDLN
jgi:sulfite reductase beta subunit-like hemoprotein